MKDFALFPTVVFTRRESIQFHSLVGLFAVSVSRFLIAEAQLQVVFKPDIFTHSSCLIEFAVEEVVIVQRVSCSEHLKYHSCFEIEQIAL